MKTKEKTDQVIVTKKEEPKVSFLSYDEENPQIIKGFDGTDKDTQNAKASLVIARHLCVNKGQPSFSSNEARLVVLEQTQIDLALFYPNHAYSYSPLHKGLHAISKTATREVSEDNGVITDSVARGARGILKRDGKVGLKQTGRYYKNDEGKMKEYWKSVTPEELKEACMVIIKNSRGNKK